MVRLGQQQSQGVEIRESIILNAPKVLSQRFHDTSLLSQHPCSLTLPTAMLYRRKWRLKESDLPKVTQLVTVHSET
jgi:hypothetical protein